MQGFRKIRNGIWGLVLSLCVLSFGAAPGNSQTLTGTWSDPAWPGTGFSIDHQGTTAFVVWYAYTDAGANQWLVATLTSTNNGASFTGAMSTFTGRGFGGSFVPGSVAGTSVGTATLTMQSPSRAVLAFNASGRTGQYSLQRYTVATQSAAGLYSGGQIADSTNCPDIPGRQATTINLAQNTTARTVTMSITYPTDQCSVNANYTQVGSSLELTGGTASCTSGIRGTFTNVQVAVGNRTISMPFTLNVTAPAVCTLTGVLGGVR